MVVSKKKLKKSQRLVSEIREVMPLMSYDRGLFEANTRKNPNDALNKIQSFGLLMRQFRENNKLKRTKSLIHSPYPLSDEEVNGKMDAKEEYILQKGVKSKTNFGQLYIEVNLDEKTRRKSSYYGNLSEGTITEEEDIAIIN
jgi:hypothetical protein